jgi:hypothetical protein
MLKATITDPAKSLLVRVTRRLFRVRPSRRRNFFTRVDGRVTTPLFVALLLVDFADVVFAVDSIPAICDRVVPVFLECIRDPQDCWHFCDRGADGTVPLSQVSLVFILVFVGIKMMLTQHYHIPNLIVAIIVAMLLAGIAASCGWGRKLTVDSRAAARAFSPCQPSTLNSQSAVGCFASTLALIDRGNDGEPGQHPADERRDAVGRGAPSATRSPPRRPAAARASREP